MYSLKKNPVGVKPRTMDEKEDDEIVDHLAI